MHKNDDIYVIEIKKYEAIKYRDDDPAVVPLDECIIRLNIDGLYDFECGFISGNGFDGKNSTPFKGRAITMTANSVLDTIEKLHIKIPEINGFGLRNKFESIQIIDDDTYNNLLEYYESHDMHVTDINVSGITFDEYDYKKMSEMCDDKNVAKANLEEFDISKFESPAFAETFTDEYKAKMKDQCERDKAIQKLLAERNKIDAKETNDVQKGGIGE